jgi:2-phosphosulfolactate phosphatase
VTTPHGQSQYQVRFDWGVAGAEAIAADADVIVVVDILSFSTDVDLALARDGELALAGATGDGAGVCVALGSHPAVIVAGSLRNADAVGRWILERQGDKGDRFTVAVIAAGEQRDDGSLRFAVEDLLGAGAIIDALEEAGIDYCSPESAAAAAAFTGLRNATEHLIGASASGRALTEHGLRANVDLAIEVNSSTVVPVLREFVFRAERSTR